jgi:tetratricopeptide (TPR) repeat protein
MRRSGGNSAANRELCYSVAMTRHRPDLHRHLQAGLAFHRANQVEAAEACYNRVLEYNPKNPDVLNLLGVIAQDRGRPAAAVQLISSALRVRRNFPEALTNLARAQRAAGDPEGAAASARRAIKLAPDLAEAHVQLGRALLDLGDNAGAAQACRVAAELVPVCLDAYVNLGAALTRAKDYSGAARAYQEAHRLAPRRAETLTDFAVALTELERYEDALRCHVRATALAPHDARVHASHAMTLKRAQDAAAAVSACQRSLTLAPDRIDVLLLLGGCLATLGRFQDAIATYQRILELDPNCAEARRSIVAAGEKETDAAEIARLRALVDDGDVLPRHRVAAGYALGALLDKAADYEGAFLYYAHANKLRRAKRIADGEGFDADELRRYVDATIERFTPALFAATRDWGVCSDVPVFIVGMPRSGTTLTEQIAASHPQVFGAGERPDIGHITARLTAEKREPAGATWDPASIRHEAVTHLNRLRKLGDSFPRIIDKMPDNILYLGVVALLFPAARIIFCKRDLRDVCLSCHFQSFSQGMPWTNDLGDCATRALEIERLAAYWKSVLPLRMHEVCYEHLVANLEGESRRLIEFLGLRWDASCLHFHLTERQVMTASLWQVRQPLYTSSIGRWRHYERHLPPLLARLAQDSSA